MTDPKNATLFATATVLLAVVGLFFIDDWLPEFPFWANIFVGHLSVMSFRISFSWIVMLASLATCWAALVTLIVEGNTTHAERETGRWNRRQNRRPRAF